MNMIENVCSLLFDSPKEKLRKRLLKSFNTRISDCCEGKIPYDSMSICEKIAYNLYGFNDANRDFGKLLELLLLKTPSYECLINMPIDASDKGFSDTTREINILVESKILSPARRIVLEYLLDKWDGVTLDTITRYVQLIVGAHYLDRFIERFSEKAMTVGIKKSVMEICMAAPNMGYKRSKYWKHKIDEINRTIREAELKKSKEEKDRKALELERRFSAHRKAQGL